MGSEPFSARVRISAAFLALRPPGSRIVAKTVCPLRASVSVNSLPKPVLEPVMRTTCLEFMIVPPCGAIVNPFDAESKAVGYMDRAPLPPSPRPRAFLSSRAQGGICFSLRFPPPLACHPEPIRRGWVIHDADSCRKGPQLSHARPTGVFRHVARPSARHPACPALRGEADPSRSTLL